MAKILVLHGPNLHLLGTREPGVYGVVTLREIDVSLMARAIEAGHDLDAYQSNSELALLERIHAAKRDGTSCIVFNPGGFTHTSVALRDALAAVGIPFIEVHVSNVHAREAFRRQSYFSDLALGSIVGLGPQGYELALIAVLARLAPRHDEREAVKTGI
ncbi:MAG TPA: type II 3-dehydroquinate dehydratase [Candidatus Saccharimonadia bacterium]|nr:type II 3-dehydroquinate dehydratase [Candidatus Saccharimonadia bacterium]